MDSSHVKQRHAGRRGRGWQRENTHCLFNLGGFRVFCLGFCCVALINSKSILRVLPKGQICAHELVSSFVPCCSGMVGCHRPPTSVRLTSSTRLSVVISSHAFWGCASLNYEKFLAAQQTSIRVSPSDSFPWTSDSWEMLSDSLTEFVVILWIWYQ